MKEIVIGNQKLKDVIKGIYIDKTEGILNLVHSVNKFYFLSRPRRFGKTLTIDTMKEMFLGNKELFKGLYAYNNYKEWDKSYPIVLISMIGYNPDINNQDILGYIKDSVNIYINGKEIPLKDYCNEDLDDLSKLIIKINKETGEKVVVLVDEYDTPFTQNLNDKISFRKVKSFFNTFYGKIKSVDDKIRFFYLSGLAKVAQTGLFSTLNNLYDISYSSKYYNLYGYTLSEIKEYFKDYIKLTIRKLGIEEENLYSELKRHYNGYFFGVSTDKLYNPWSINNFFEQQEFNNYWGITGGTSLLDSVIKFNEKTFKETFLKAELGFLDSKYIIGSIDNVEDSNIMCDLLLNAGYLTYSDDKKFLKIPNNEIRVSMLKQYQTYLEKQNPSLLTFLEKYSNLAERIVKGDEKGITDALKDINNDNIPGYEWIRKNPEGIMKYQLYTALKFNGLIPFCEPQTAEGRIDIAFVDNAKIYIIEYKVDGKLEEGMKQLNNKYSKYFQGKEGYKIVINWHKGTNNFDVLVEAL